MDIITYHTRTDLLDWTKRVLDEAIAFAKQEAAEIERARAYHLALAIKRGTCAIGHDLTLAEVPKNWNGQHPCGYCTSARGDSCPNQRYI